MTRATVISAPDRCDGHLTRRGLLWGAGGLWLASALDPAWALDAVDTRQSALLRIRIVTIGAGNPQQVADLYARWLGFQICEAGLVSPAMAASWGAPGSAGRPCFMLCSAGYPDVFVRVVGIDPVPGYAHSTSSGWNSFEFMVDNLDELYRNLQGSPFRTLNAPHAPVEAFPTVFSMDVVGPAEEMIFLTCEEGDRAKSWLPLPKARVGRSHLAWLAGPDILKLRDWYSDAFALAKGGVLDRPVPGAPAGTTMPNTMLMLKDRGNFIEFEGNPRQFGPRPHGDGQLPPGNAMASFGVADLDALGLAYITPPRLLYGQSRAATVLDPHGNRVELIEEARG